MRDLFFVFYLLVLLGIGFRKPFLFVLGYIYIDLVSPQRLSYYMLSGIPISLIFFVAAVLGFMISDDKTGMRMVPRQGIMLLLLILSGLTTMNADFPDQALEKWDWVWKTLIFAIFLPFTLRTRLRIESVILFFIFGAASIIIIGGIKTLFSGGGYGTLNLGLESNSGLYEGSTISTVAIAIIPFILFILSHGTLFKINWISKAFGYALIFACLLIPVGTEARTGLLCVGVLVVLKLRDVKHRFMYVCGVGLAVMIAVPLLPSSYSNRMETIEGYKGDQSASTRLAIWKWTLGFVADRPFGGGFGAYRQNRILVKTETGSGAKIDEVADAGRAWHSSYFEMLGEQGWLGLFLWLTLNIAGLIRMEVVRRRYRNAKGDMNWVSPLASALQSAHIVYLVGSLFLALAFQSFAYIWMGLEIGLDTYSRRRGEGARPVSWRTGKPSPKERDVLSVTR
jgi:probable O-glycosylation ligase (exosortase A-associated)